MSIELRNRIYETLRLAAEQREIADLVGWQDLRAVPSLGRHAARYLPHADVIEVSQQQVDALLEAGRESDILGLLLHEFTHRAIGHVLGDNEVHNSLFAGIAWGLQARVGAQSCDPAYDIAGEPDAIDRARRIASAITSASSAAEACERVDSYIGRRRAANKSTALAHLPWLALLALPFIYILISNGNLIFNLM